MADYRNSISEDKTDLLFFSMHYIHIMCSTHMYLKILFSPNPLTGVDLEGVFHQGQCACHEEEDSASENICIVSSVALEEAFQSLTNEP